MNKAEKSQIIVLIACFACVFLSAALIWNYYKKPADENEALIVTIKYPEYENAVITPVSTMECAIDNEFLHELQQISSSSDGNTDEHSYNYQYDTVPDKIYIKAPDIYVFEQGKSKSSMTPCSVGSIAYYDDAPWFSITAVTIDKLYTGVFDITISKLSTTTSSGGLILALQRAITTARPEGRYRKHCYWLRYKAVLLESSLLESSACSLIYFCTASSVILPIVST